MVTNGTKSDCSVADVASLSAANGSSLSRPAKTCLVCTLIILRYHVNASLGSGEEDSCQILNDMVQNLQISTRLSYGL